MEEYLKTIGRVSADLWKVFKAAVTDNSERNDEWWEKITEAINNATKQFRGTDCEQYAREYAVTLIKELERRSKA